MSKELISLTAAVESLAAGEGVLGRLVNADRARYYQAWRQASDAWHTAEGLLAGVSKELISLTAAVESLAALEEADAAKTARLDAEDALDARGKEEGR